MRRLIPPLLVMLMLFSPAMAAKQHRYYIPLVDNTQRNIGAEGDRINEYHNPNALTKLPVKGYEVITHNGYDWTIPDTKFAGYKPDWITVKTAPSWMTGGEICKLPMRHYWNDYFAFIAAVIDRYDPEYVEIWNEPDATATWAAEHFGCIGDGVIYGEFIDYAYQYLQPTDTQIIFGAVSDPYGSFILSALEETNGNYDGISFHCYEHYWDRLLNGCVGRYQYIDELSDKPAYLSETAVIWKRGTIDGFEAAQVEYFNRLMTKIPTPWFWYMYYFNGWPQDVNVDMRTRTEARPVYTLYRNAYAAP